MDTIFLTDAQNANMFSHSCSVLTPCVFLGQLCNLHLNKCLQSCWDGVLCECYIGIHHNIADKNLIELKISWLVKRLFPPHQFPINSATSNTGTLTKPYL